MCNVSYIMNIAVFLHVPASLVVILKSEIFILQFLLLSWHVSVLSVNNWREKRNKNLECFF